MGRADGIRESAGVGVERNRLNLGEMALLIADFVNARTKTTSGDVAERFAVDRRSASQYLRRLWLGGFIGKRARGLFMPVQSSPAPGGHSEDTDDCDHIEDFVDAVVMDEFEDAERVEDSRETGDSHSCEIDESDESEDTVDTEELDDTESFDGDNVSASGCVDIEDTNDRALTDDGDDSGDSEQSADLDDTGDCEESEDASASAGLTSGLKAVTTRKGNPKACPAGRCPDCGSELGKTTGKCHACILKRARKSAHQAVTAS